MCSVDPLTHKEYVDIDKVQSAACACDAHLTTASASAASRKHGRNSQPTMAAARVEKRPKFSALRDSGKVANWLGAQPADFTCEQEGRLADPLPAFFEDWKAKCPRFETTGKINLPQDLLMEGKLGGNICFHKGCRQPGHRWDHCPKLAMHVAKNPAVRGF
ncbi:hypothetical protein ABBQ32_007496 [Trebouxia sp. C0010 RCD-2024]